MTFTQRLFEQVCEAMPNTTARTFSRDCGKSEGYYGSLTAQKLPISTNALMCLVEVLECRKELMRDMTPGRLASIETAQQMIADEIAQRMQTIECDNLAVRKIITGAVARTIVASEQRCYPPIFVM